MRRTRRPRPGCINVRVFRKGSTRRLAARPRAHLLKGRLVARRGRGLRQVYPPRPDPTAPQPLPHPALTFEFHDFFVRKPGFARHGMINREDLDLFTFARRNRNGASMLRVERRCRRKLHPPASAAT